MGWFTLASKKPAAKASRSKIEKCPTCKKSLLACPGHRGGVKEKEKVKVQGSDGRTRTVTRNTGHTIRDGITWCGTCSCRRINGLCTNVTCSTRRTS